VLVQTPVQPLQYQILTKKLPIVIVMEYLTLQKSQVVMTHKTQQDASSPAPSGNQDTNPSNGIKDGIDEFLKGLTGTPTITTPTTTSTDSDGDGIPDATEVATGTDPQDAASPDNVGNNGSNDDDSNGVKDGIDRFLNDLTGTPTIITPTTTSTDTDGDGIPDATEVANGTDPQDASSPAPSGNQDTNPSNGIKDGIDEFLKGLTGTPTITTPTTTSTDSDGDGIPDATEVATGTDPQDAASPDNVGNNGSNDDDSNGVKDGIDRFLNDLTGTPTIITPITTSTDTDGDGIPDATEVANGTDPQDASSPAPTGNQDTNPSNGIKDGIDEFLKGLTGTPTITTPTTTSTDSDGDGIPDATEVATGTDPQDAASPDNVGNNGSNDDDSNGVKDGIDRFLNDLTGTPTIITPITTSTDTDGDGIPDATEVANGTDPQDASSPAPTGNQDTNPSNGIKDGIDEFLKGLTGTPTITTPTTTSTDSDGDGIPDATEVATGTDPQDAASPDNVGNNGSNDDDSNGVKDGIDRFLNDLTGTPTIITPITTSTDTDGDGIPDATEVANGTDPQDASSPAPTGNQDTNPSNGIKDGIDEFLKGLTGTPTITTPTTTSTDSDGDGIPDATEVATGTDPQDAASPDNVGNNGSNDDDSNGVKDGIDRFLNDLTGTPTIITPITTSTDTDGDGIPDATEVANGTDPQDASSPAPSGNQDTNPSNGIKDGIDEFLKGLTGTPTITTPTTTSTDSDGDGIPDATEVANWHRPTRCSIS
jgi:hypothetical protein